VFPCVLVAGVVHVLMYVGLVVLLVLSVFVDSFGLCVGGLFVGAAKFYASLDDDWVVVRFEARCLLGFYVCNHGFPPVWCDG